MKTSEQKNTSMKKKIIRFMESEIGGFEAFVTAMILSLCFGYFIGRAIWAMVNA